MGPGFGMSELGEHVCHCSNLVVCKVIPVSLSSLKDRGFVDAFVAQELE